jgi:hypothetical protein
LTETIAAVSERFPVSADLLVRAASTAADKSRIYFIYDATMPTVAEVRDSMRRADITERRLLAERFAQRVAGQAGVQDVMVVALEPDLSVAVVVDDLDMERELALHRAFIDLARELDDPATGDLAVFVAGDDVLPEGESLT